MRPTGPTYESSFPTTSRFNEAQDREHCICSNVFAVFLGCFGLGYQFDKARQTRRTRKSTKQIRPANAQLCLENLHRVARLAKEGVIEIPSGVEVEGLQPVKPPSYEEVFRLAGARDGMGGGGLDGVVEVSSEEGRRRVVEERERDREYWSHLPREQLRQQSPTRAVEEGRE